MKRRSLLAGAIAFLASGCSRIAETGPVSSLLSSVEDWNRNLHDLIGRRSALAREFSPEDISPDFRGNGTVDPQEPAYLTHAAEGFANWLLEVSGLVERRLSLSLADIHALPQRTQITRHDCVEGWSAIGQWTGPQLKHILDAAGLRPEARYIIFHCADRMGGVPYYESVDLIDAFHPQTIVAHALNGEPLPIKNGAPLRMRIERQLGYKHAKYVHRIEAVATLEEVAGGKGGFWEDAYGYEWYAGI